MIISCDLELDPINDLYIKTRPGSFPNMWQSLVRVAFCELLGARSKKKERTTAKHGAQYMHNCTWERSHNNKTSK